MTSCREAEAVLYWVQQRLCPGVVLGRRETHHGDLQCVLRLNACQADDHLRSIAARVLFYREALLDLPGVCITLSRRRPCWQLPQAAVGIVFVVATCFLVMCLSDVSDRLGWGRMTDAIDLQVQRVGRWEDRHKVVCFGLDDPGGLGLALRRLYEYGYITSWE